MKLVVAMKYQLLNKSLSRIEYLSNEWLITISHIWGKKNCCKKKTAKVENSNFE